MVDWLLSLPALVKLLFTLVFLFALIQARLPMGPAFLAGSALVAILFPMTWAGYGGALWSGLISEDTISVLLIVVGILVLTEALDESGQTGRIIDSFRELAGTNRWMLVTFPALIGLLPMPGGAIFSAPMVAASVEKNPLSPARQTAANYWFRHIWEFWLPLYPGVILALSLTKAPMTSYTLMQLPMTVGALAMGYVVILRPIRFSETVKGTFSWGRFLGFLKELSPILIVIGAVIFFSPVARAAARNLPSAGILLERSTIPAGLVLAFLWLMVVRGLTVGSLGRQAMKPGVRRMAALILGLMVFKSALERCGAVPALREELTGWGVPLAAAVCILPFVAGLIVGIAVGFVGTSFPLVIALVSVVPEADRLPYYFLAYVMGYTGMMLSPLHTCLLLTNEYFKSSLGRVYLYLLPLCAWVLLLGSLLFILYGVFGRSALEV